MGVEEKRVLAGLKLRNSVSGVELPSPSVTRLSVMARRATDIVSGRGWVSGTVRPASTTTKVEESCIDRPRDDHLTYWLIPLEWWADPTRTRMSYLTTPSNCASLPVRQPPGLGV